MGYWGNRAKDGDSPLDYFDAFKEKHQSPNAYLRKAFKECKQEDGSDWAGGYFAVFGCATLMIEAGHKVEPKLLTEIYEKAKNVVEGFCPEDKAFYNNYVKNGVVMNKKPYKVFVEIDVDAFDEEFAKKEAAETLGISFGEKIRERKDVKVTVKTI